jgi:hypothetical protein
MSDWPPTEFELCNGPQDGAKVKRIGDVMPQTIYVGSKWQGDGYAAWGREKSDRFPVCYVMDAFKFVFRSDRRQKKPKTR